MQRLTDSNTVSQTSLIVLPTLKYMQYRGNI